MSNILIKVFLKDDRIINTFRSEKPMNKYIFHVSTAVLAIIVLAIIYELVINMKSSLQKKVDNFNLMNFIENTGKMSVLKEKISITWRCVYMELINVFLIYSLLILLQYLSTLNDMLKEAKDMSDDETIQADENEAISDGGSESFIKPKNVVLYLFSYIYLQVNIDSYYKRTNFLVNTILPILGFWFYLKINVWLFKKLGIYKSIIFWISFTFMNYYQKIHYDFKVLTPINSPEPIVSREIVQHLEHNNIKFKFYESSSQDEVNVKAYWKDDIANFVLVGDYKILTIHELKGLLYHEIENLINNSAKKKTIFLVVNSCLCLSLELLFLVHGRTIEMECFSISEIYFMCECFFNSIASTVSSIMNNAFSQYNEILSDDYSKEKIHPTHLANAIMEIECYNSNPMFLTVPCSYLYDGQPTTIHRLRNLEFE